MEKAEKCTTAYNMRRVGEAAEGIRMVCLFAKHRQIFRDIIEAVGGYESSGTCENHEEYYAWWTNQPEEPIESGTTQLVR